MIKMNKTSVFDSCVNANMNNYDTLIDPMYDEFQEFYKSYKDTFKGNEEIISEIIFKQTEDYSASFTVICVKDVEIPISNNTKCVTVEKTENLCRFTVHQNKA